MKTTTNVTRDGFKGSTKPYNSELFLDHEKAVRFSIFCAEQALSVFESQYPDDKRPRMAVEAAKELLGDVNATKVYFEDLALGAMGAARDAEKSGKNAQAFAARAAEKVASVVAMSDEDVTARISAWAAAWEVAYYAEMAVRSAALSTNASEGADYADWAAKFTSTEQILFLVKMLQGEK